MSRHDRRPILRSSPRIVARPPELSAVGCAWRCRTCQALLGRVLENRLHIKVRSCSEYLASLPCTATCRHCGALNEVAHD